MARNKMVLMSTLLILVLLSACNLNSQENGDIVDDFYAIVRETVDDLRHGEIAVFRLRHSANLQAFLMKPSLEFIYRNVNVISVYSHSNRGREYINAFGVSSAFPERGRSTGGTQPSGFFRIGHLKVCAEFVDFVNNTKNFKNILSNHKVDSEILGVTIFTYEEERNDAGLPPPGGIPSIMVIWINTVEGDYFLEYAPSSVSRYPYAAFMFNFYTLEEYREKRGLQ